MFIELSQKYFTRYYQFGLYGFNIIALFGSYATNSQTYSSDIDLLYEVDNTFLEKYRGFASVSNV